MKQLISLTLLSLFSLALLSSCNHKAKSEFVAANDSVATTIPIVDTTHQTTTNQPPITNADIKASRETMSDTSALTSMIETSEVKFDEDFNPVAKIVVHNTRTKEIDEILFRFTFTNHRLSDGQIDPIVEREYSTFMNITAKITAPFVDTLYVRIPQPQRKNFDMPNIFITKVRYFDGTIDSDVR